MKALSNLPPGVTNDDVERQATGGEQRTASSDLPFYRLQPDEPMCCVCDMSGANEADFCKKCPMRAEHREAAHAELAERVAKAAGSKP